MFVNRLTVDDKYFCSVRDNFPQPIQMQLSKKPETFWESFIVFLKST